MNDDIMESEEEIRTMILDGKKAMNHDEQLVFIMKRFNLDWDTVESMPAFDEHRKLLFSREIEK